MNKYKRIFIVGHVGAGKAIFAKALADKLGWKFIDADFGLEFHMGRTLTEIIGKQGEESFHQCTAEILANQIEKEKIVVATDGNILATEKNRKLLSSEFVIYLKVTTPIQLERLTREPLLSIADFKEFFDKLHLERDSLYEKSATFTINTSESLDALDDAVSETIKAFSA